MLRANQIALIASDFKVDVIKRIISRCGQRKNLKQKKHIGTVPARGICWSHDPIARFFIVGVLFVLFVACEPKMYHRSSLLSLHFLVGEKRRQEIRLLFAGYLFVTIMNLLRACLHEGERPQVSI